MEVKIEQLGKKTPTLQHTEINFCALSGFKWLENVKLSSPHFHMLIKISL